MEQKGLGRVADQFANEDCLTLEQVSKEMNLGTLRVRQLMLDGIARKIIPNLQKKDGVRLLFPEPMIDKLKEAYQNGLFGKPKQRKDRILGKSIKHAKSVLQVPIFDPDVYDILMSQFQTNEKLVQHLQKYLVELTTDKKGEIEALKAKFQADMERLLRKNGTKF